MSIKKKHLSLFLSEEDKQDFRNQFNSIKNKEGRDAAKDAVKQVLRKAFEKSLKDLFND